MTRLLSRHRGEAPRATGRKMMRRADDVMLHVCADACPAAGVRGRGYAMLPHEVRVPVARDGCDVDFTSSLGGRDDRCAPCTAHPPAVVVCKSVSSVVRYRLVCRITSNFFFSSVRTTQAQSSDQESDVTLGDPRSFLRLRRRPGGPPGSIEKATGAFAGTLAAHTKQSRF